MKDFLATLMILTAAPVMFAQISFTGSPYEVITERPEASTGLNAVYVVNDCAGVTVSYTSSNGRRANWLTYSNLGCGYATEVEGISYAGSTSSLRLPSGDAGYIIEDGTDRYYFYIIDYAAHPYDVTAITPSAEQDCDQVSLDIIGQAGAINFYSINGRSVELDRGITLSYATMVLDDADKIYRIDQADVSFSHLSSTIHAPAPLCDTEFYLEGDRFLQQWGMAQDVTSTMVPARAVAAYTSATQVARDNPNENNPSGDSLGGSAPAEVEFYAAVTDAAIFTEWQLSTYPDFDDIQLRISEPVTSYTFRDMGTTYVRFVCANAEGCCEYYGDTYEVSIGQSSLLCPNAFSPGASEGVNDEWKVSYSSIVDFECYIFNRLGVKMAEFHDPALGWDGRYNGKLVPAGVYYYVIKARGSDGKDYNLSGDINIVGYK
ncbi:MAG: gliding motility-associated C-terminal domain-containing protein [Lachnoclostridium sp.]|nr:gliding motility-associated C-terminal domain-containing protein [Lachnoclostridium sp.]